MEIQIHSTEVIKPSAPTPHHLKHFKVSFLDQTCAPFYIPLTLFYKPEPDPNVPQIHTRLKKSLSETLTRFYPLAGRIQDLYTIHCNDEGALYTEATANVTLSEFLQKPDINSINKFLPCNTGVLDDGLSFQVSVQVTVLVCGAIVIGVCLFHRVADITTMANFLRAWTEFCLEKTDNNVYHDLTVGSSLFPPLSPIPDDYIANNTNFYFNATNHTQARRFVFGSSAIAALRARAASKEVPRPSRIESLTGFITERLMAGLENKQTPPPPTLMITHAVNIRRRMDPPLPDTTFGNFTWFAVAFYSTGEPVLKVSDYVETLREVLAGLDGESLRELEPESVISTLNESQGMLGTSEDVKVYKFTSWCNMGFYDMDFGWGRPAWVAHMGEAGHRPTKHQFMFMEGRNQGEIEVWMLFGEEEIAWLENDAEFTAFATPNPSILV